MLYQKWQKKINKLKSKNIIELTAFAKICDKSSTEESRYFLLSQERISSFGAAFLNNKQPFFILIGI